MCLSKEQTDAGRFIKMSKSSLYIREEAKRRWRREARAAADCRICGSVKLEAMI